VLKIPKHRLLPFRSPVMFDEDVIRELCRRARDGYRKRLKAETFGFLYGRLGRLRRGRRGQLHVHIAEYYRGGRKSRTGVVFKDWRTILRAHKRRMARVYAKRRSGIRQVPARVVPDDLVVLF
jgi:hypothetical protein